MRKQLHEVREIDRYLFHEMNPVDKMNPAGRMSFADRLVFQTRMILQPELKEKVRLQQKAHAFIRWCSRKDRKDELETIYTRLMNDTAFNNTIHSIFS